MAYFEAIASLYSVVVSGLISSLSTYIQILLSCVGSLKTRWDYSLSVRLVQTRNPYFSVGMKCVVYRMLLSYQLVWRLPGETEVLSVILDFDMCRGGHEQPSQYFQ